MKIGYPCLNTQLGCSAARSFRLSSYSDERLRETSEGNLTCLRRILQFNVERGIYFFRISSDTIPFASHPVCTFPWQEEFAGYLQEIGEFIRQHGIRISMHPDQFVLLNALKETVVENSIRELQYHADLLDGLQLDMTAKIQIHIGGVYGQKETSIERFIETYLRLPETIRRRLVIENDDRLYSLRDALAISEQTGIPVLFDSFHHGLLNQGEPLREALILAGQTWTVDDGRPMVDYSSQQAGKRLGSHTNVIDLDDFQVFLLEIDGLDVDIMLEIKDKEASAMEAVALARQLLHL